MLDFQTDEERLKGWRFLYDAGPNGIESSGDFQDHLFFAPTEDYDHRCDNTIHLVVFS